MRLAILGSGPTAAAAALAMVDELDADAGWSLDVLDYGLTRDRVEPVDAAAMHGPARKSMPEREYAFVVPPSFRMASGLEGAVAGSAAFGGWSNVWGATLLPYTDWGLRPWGRLQSEVRNQFAFLEESVPRLDARSGRVLPEFTARPRRWVRGDREVSRGPSLLAVDPLAATQEQGCNECGQCLQGCPADRIWSSRRSFAQLLRHPSVRRVDGVWVHSVEEAATSVQVRLVRPDGGFESRSYDRVLVALGALQTAALALRSGIAEGPVAVRDSRMVLIPFHLDRFAATGTDDPRIALSDGFVLATSVPESPEPDFYAQVYGYSQSFAEQVVERMPLLDRLPGFIRRAGLSRIGVAMSFFDQAESGELVLDRGRADEVTITGDPRAGLSQAGRERADAVLAVAGLRALPVGAAEAPVGLGYHFGASFPMRLNPQARGNRSDAWGRPGGCSRIHLVDTSVFPRVAATPITWTAMANAARIARGAVHMTDAGVSA